MVKHTEECLLQELRGVIIIALEVQVKNKPRKSNNVVKTGAVAVKKALNDKGHGKHQYSCN